MPLHDWTNQSGWEGVRHLWLTELLRYVKPRLPDGYRVYIGSMPRVAVDGPSEHSYMGMPRWPAESAAPAVEESNLDETDEEVALTTLEIGYSLFIERRGFLIAAVELVSPRNKDRPGARAGYAARYAGYLLEGIHLLLIDVHRRPLNFSFADQIAQELQMSQPPPLPPPMAVTYRVGEPAATGGRFLAVWRRPLTVGSALPTVTLPLTTSMSVPVDLEQTYRRAAEDAYLP